MTLSYEATSQFKRDWRKLSKQGLDMALLEEAMTLLIDEALLDIEYRNHKLSPKNQGNWECHIGGRNSDWLLLYKYYPELQLIVFTRTGSHSELFRK